MDADASLVRALGLLVPLAATCALWRWRRPTRRARAAALLACAWNLPTLLFVQWLAARCGWWHFEARGGLLSGVPLDLYLGWVLLWGVIPLLALSRVRFWLMLLAMLGIDVWLMPACRPVVQLGRAWFVGEALALLLCLAPAQLLARWTLLDRRLAWRAMLQVVLFGGLVCGLLPAVIVKQTKGDWSALVARPAWLNSLLVQLLLLPVVVGLSAVQEFATRGRGTPLPYDPPRRIVTSGVYAYVANPMQLSACALLAGWGAVLGSWWVAGAGLMCVAYGAGLAWWDEEEDLRARFGDDWANYRRMVRAWWPRWRPRHQTVARLYVAETCGMCGEIGRWLQARRPVKLEIAAAAESHPLRDLRRLTYEADAGMHVEEGVAAFARALEHLNLGWALAGCALRLPVIGRFAQLLVDAAGGGPRLVRRSGAAASCSAPESSS